MSNQTDLIAEQKIFEKLVLNKIGLQWKHKIPLSQKSWLDAPFWIGCITLIVLYTLAGAYSPIMASSLSS
jgi:hypothetical protein